MVAKLFSVRDYTDFREYLSQIVQAEKADSWSSSLEQVASRFGMSRSSLSMILSKKRDLTGPVLHRIAGVLQLDFDDHQYFEALVLLNQSKTESEKLYYAKRLELGQEQINETKSVYSIRTPSKSLVSRWYIPSILVFLLDNPKTSRQQVASALSSMLEIDESELEKVILRLESEGFLSFKGKGSVHIAFDRLSSSLTSKTYLRNVYLEAIKQMEKGFYHPEYFYTAHTYSVPLNQIQVFVDEYKELLNRFISMAEKSNDQKRIVNACFQLFPVLDSIV